MRAAVFQGLGREHRIERIPDPVPTPTDLLLKVLSAGICSSELHLSDPSQLAPSLRRQFTPFFSRGVILGHEFAGEIVEIGSEVTKFRIGDRITTMAYSGCGRCGFCLSGEIPWCTSAAFQRGGFAQFAIANERSSVRLSDGVAYQAGCLVEPMAASLHAVRLSVLEVNEDVLVIGQGLIGLAVIYFARRFGAGRIVAAARSLKQAELASAMGADHVVRVGPELDAATTEFRRGAPGVVFECAGTSDALDLSLAYARPRGKVVVVGVCVSNHTWVPASPMLKELSIQFAQAYSLDDLRYTQDLIAKGLLQPLPLISKVTTLEDFPATFEALRRSTGECRVVVDPWA